MADRVRSITCRLKKLLVRLRYENNYPDFKTIAFRETVDYKELLTQCCNLLTIKARYAKKTLRQGLFFI